MYRFLQTCSLVLSGIGLLSLLLARLISPFLGLLTTAVVLLSCYRRKWGINLSERRYLFLLPIPLAVLLADYLLISSPLPWLMHVTIFLMLTKYWSARYERDVLQVFTISFIHIVASAAVAQDVAFGFILFVYVFAAVWGFISFNCARDVRLAAGEREVSIDDSEALRRIPFRPMTHLPFVTVTTLSLILLLGLTGFFFVIIPRAGAPAVLGGTFQDLRTGFSDSVDLGSIGEIKQSNEVVFRAVLTDGADGLSLADRIYWRGVTVDRFDGERWSRSSLVEKRDRPKTAPKGGRLRSDVARPGDAILRQQILLNPIGTHYLFGIAEMVEINPQSGRFERAVYSPVDGSWRLDYRPGQRMLYEVLSVPERDGNREAVSRWGRNQMGDEFFRAYLQVPESIQEELSKIAWNWTTTERSTEERADAILQHLRTEYEYTLDMGEGGEPVSVVEFLEETKRGHCEYYASAMALLVRVLGVPSRVVTGFLAGEWNPHGNYFIVRQQDAHSWVEVYLPEKGWVTYDPTPPNTGFPLMRRGPLPAVERFIDSLQLRWSRHVLSFELRDQLGILQRIHGVAARTSAVVSRPLRELTRQQNRPYGILGMEIIVLGIIFSTIAIVAFRSLRGRKIARPEWRKRWRRLRLSRRQVGLARDYLNLIRYCEKRSHPKPEVQTYLEFSRELEDMSKRFTGLSEATDLYYRQRFARIRNGKADRERIRKLSREIRKRSRAGTG